VFDEEYPDEKGIDPKQGIFQEKGLRLTGASFTYLVLHTFLQGLYHISKKKKTK